MRDYDFDSFRPEKKDWAFRVCELVPAALAGIEGKIKYPPEFDEVI